MRTQEEIASAKEHHCEQAEVSLSTSVNSRVSWDFRQGNGDQTPIILIIGAENGLLGTSAHISISGARELAALLLRAAEHETLAREREEEVEQS